MKIRKPHIILLFSDTGGGHRSAAEAIRDALKFKYPGKIDIEMVDFVKVVGRTPLNKIPDLYPWIVKIPKAWEFGYRITDTKIRSKLFQETMSLYSKKKLQNFIKNNPSNLLVSTHFGANAFLDYLPPNGPKMISIITDLVSVHQLWFDNRVDLCIFPTETPYRQALEEGMDPKQIKVVGLPVNTCFKPAEMPKKELKKLLDWPTNKPVALIMGGSFGYGPIEEIIERLCKNYNIFTIVVVAGKNTKLKNILLKRNWSKPVKIYGFVKNIAQMMQAADILITKAGSLTLAEAFSVGLPIILYDYLPGQEEGNVIYLTEKNAGIYNTDPAKIAATVDDWLDKPSKLDKMSKASLKLSQANAADKIAEIIAEKLKIC